MPGIGTLVNTVAILLGGIVGLLLKKGIPERFHNAVFTAAGMSVLIMGLSGVITGSITAAQDGTLTSAYTLTLLFSMILGAAVGEWLNIDGFFERTGEKMKQLVSKDDASSVGVGFATASILMCAGAMAILGSIEDGVSHAPQTLYMKAVLDGIGSIMFTALYGWGVLLSAGSVFVYQGVLTILAVVAAPLLSPAVVTQMSFVGSALLMMLAFNMLGMQRFKVANFIPATFFPLIFSLFIR